MKDLICINCNEYVETFENNQGDTVCSECKSIDCFLESEYDDEHK